MNGYGSKPPYGCKIEWSLWKMGTEIIEGERWCHTGLSFLLFSTSWLDKYTRFLWDRQRQLVDFMRILVTCITCLLQQERFFHLNISFHARRDGGLLFFSGVLRVQVDIQLRVTSAHEAPYSKVCVVDMNDVDILLLSTIRLCDREQHKSPCWTHTTNLNNGGCWGFRSR